MQVLKYLDYVFTGVFTFEMVIKVRRPQKIHFHHMPHRSFRSLVIPPSFRVPRWLTWDCSSTQALTFVTSGIFWTSLWSAALWWPSPAREFSVIVSYQQMACSVQKKRGNIAPGSFWLTHLQDLLLCLAIFLQLKCAKCRPYFLHTKLRPYLPLLGRFPIILIF